jgi:predicted permease
MKSLRRFFTRLFNSATRRAQDERLREEIEEHIALQTDENLRAGLSPIEARRQAMLKFGGVEAMKEDYRAERGMVLIENLVRDIQFAFRMLRKSPGFAAVAVITLAVAIGANAVVFGVLNGLILRPLHVPRAESLWGIERGSDLAVNQSYPDYLDLRDRNRSFEDLAAYNVAGVGVDTGNNPSDAWILEVTGNYFDALGVQPYLGRFFHAADEHGPNSAPYVVLTYAYWHTHFQDDRGVVGRTVQLNKHPFTILGVAPQDFRGTLVFVFPDFWVPLVNQEQIEGVDALNSRGSRGLLMVLGHLKTGVTPAQAVADLNSVGSYLEMTYPSDDGQMTFSLTRPGLTGDWLGRPLRAFLAALMLLAGLILLAACANLGNLFAARAADRSKEIAVRLALGSGPARILRQLFTEALLISLIGGAVGLWGSVALLRAMSVWQPLPTAPIQMQMLADADANVYLVALVLSVLSGFLFGAVPVRQVLRTDPYLVIKSGLTSGLRRRISVRDMLLVVQIAICAVLVTASLVAVRGLVRSLHSNFGFEPRNAMLVETDLNTAGYRGEQVPVMQKRMFEALEIIPGVKSVGMVDRLPLYYGANSTIVFTDQTADLRPTNAAAEAMIYKISPEYFNAAQTSLLAGRTFTWHDDKDAPRVAVINRQFANKIFGSTRNAVGNYYKAEGARIQVVGIVEDGKYASLAEDPQPAMFFPVLQSPSTQLCLVVRSNGDPQQLGTAIKSTVQNLDAGLPFTLHTWTQELESALFPSRMATLALGVMGTLGAMLSVTGIFGMAAYSVSKRLKELGIRIALGAQRRELLQAALGRAFKLLAVGSVAGLLLGILASRVLAFIVYQATPRDPVVLAGVLLAMMFVGLLATWIPAQRALNIDPLQLLREE